jgi:hypothetical protein
MAEQVANNLTTVLTTDINLESGSITLGIRSYYEILNYNFNTQTRTASSTIDIAEELGIQSSMVNLQCTSCYAFAAPSVSLKIVIVSYELTQAILLFTGEMLIDLQMDGSVDELSGTWWAKVTKKK